MRRCWALAAVALGLAAAPQPAGAAITIGQTFPETGQCGGGGNPGLTMFQAEVASGTSYTVPSDGVITSWSFKEGSQVAEGLRFKVGRPAGESSYTIVPRPTPSGEPAASHGPADQQRPHALEITPTRWPVRAGDVIGIFTRTFSCFTTNAPGDRIVRNADGDLPLGPLFPFSNASFLGKIPVSAKLEPDVDGDGFGDETQEGPPECRQTYGYWPVDLNRSATVDIRVPCVDPQEQPLRYEVVRPPRHGSIDGFHTGAGGVAWATYRADPAWPNWPEAPTSDYPSDTDEFTVRAVAADGRASNTVEKRVRPYRPTIACPDVRRRVTAAASVQLACTFVRSGEPIIAPLIGWTYSQTHNCTESPLFQPYQPAVCSEKPVDQWGTPDCLNRAYGLRGALKVGKLVGGRRQIRGGRLDYRPLDGRYGRDRLHYAVYDSGQGCPFTGDYNPFAWGPVLVSSVADVIIEVPVRVAGTRLLPLSSNLVVSLRGGLSVPIKNLSPNPATLSLIKLTGPARCASPCAARARTVSFASSRKPLRIPAKKTRRLRLRVPRPRVKLLRKLGKVDATLVVAVRSGTKHGRARLKVNLAARR